MAYMLSPGRNDLYREIERGYPLEGVLVEGRILQSMFHDA